LACAVYFGILGFILMGVVPSFERMFEAVGIQFEHLPRMTAAVILCGRWTSRLWPLYVGLAVIGSSLASKIPPKRHLVFEIGLVVVVAVTMLVSLSLLLPYPSGTWIFR